jgi:uncharacterized protein (TIGR02145 family)
MIELLQEMRTDMKKENRIFNRMLLIMTLILVFTSGCKKDSPEISYGSITDQSGNTYKTVEIGTQTWMAENLATTRFNDNIAIPNVAGNSEWTDHTTPAYCWVNNDETASKPIYGALYNWYAVATGKLCPAGWHVASDAEFKVLETYLGMTQLQADEKLWRGTDQGSQLKSATGWKAGENGSNSSGFSALPGGYRYHLDGLFNNVGELGYWWCSDENDPSLGTYRRLDGNNDGIYRESTLKAAGKSVRCIKD